MKQPRKRPVPAQLTEDTALKHMMKGARLVRTDGARVTYSVSPGGPVSTETACEILAHPLCEIADVGLFPDHPQSWRLDWPNT